jgi:hypothetical protein
MLSLLDPTWLVKQLGFTSLRVWKKKFSVVAGCVGSFSGNSGYCGR